MTINKEIIVDSDTHILVKFHADAGGANNNFAMVDFSGGVNNTSVVAIECIDYSLFETDEKCIITFSDLSSNHATLYNLFGQGRIGSVGTRITEDMDADTHKALRVVFSSSDCKGTVLIQLRKVSGFG